MKGDLIPDAIPEPVPPEPFDEILAAWNAMATAAKLPTCRKLTDKMRASIRERWKEDDFRDNWRRAIEGVQTIPWMCGKNERGWKCKLRYVIRSEETYSKILDELANQATSVKPAASTVDEQRMADALNAISHRCEGVVEDG